jgi:hypothetical protein
MIHHVSFNARDPERVAAAVAHLVGGTALRAPVPPFPAGSWFVCDGDDAGTMLEIFPWGAVRDPDARGVGSDPAMRPRTGTHLMVGTPLDADAVAALAAREGWAARPGNAGLFRFTEVWVENAFLLELMTPDQQRDYVAAFGRAGLPALDATLRRLEAELAAAS